MSHQPPETVDVVLAKAPPQLDVVYQERFSTILLSWVAAGEPSLTVQRRTAAGDQRVDVGMVPEPLVSCVQHQMRGWLELPRLSERLVQGSPSGMEQQIVQGSTIAQSQARQSTWQREDDLEVVDLG